MIAEATTILGELEASLGVPTFALFAHWRGEYAVDLDEEAGRLLSTMIIERIREQQAEQIALIVDGRGGYPTFADAVLRTTRQLNIELQTIPIGRIDGSIGLLALGAKLITLHPQAGIGALDRGLCVGAGREEPDHFISRDQRQIARYLLKYYLQPHEQPPPLDNLFLSTLGQGVTAPIDLLEKFGLNLRIAPDPLAEQLEELRRWAADALNLFEPPGARFKVSAQWAEEVEFEPATYISAAAIIGVERGWTYELDTGSPDPDAPRLAGRWRPATLQ